MIVMRAPKGAVLTKCVKPFCRSLRFGTGGAVVAPRVARARVAICIWCAAGVLAGCGGSTGSPNASTSGGVSGTPTPKPLGSTVKFSELGFMYSMAQITPLTEATTMPPFATNTGGRAQPGTHFLSLQIVVNNLQTDRPAPYPFVELNNAILQLGNSPCGPTSAPTLSCQNVVVTSDYSILDQIASSASITVPIYTFSGVADADIPALMQGAPHLVVNADHGVAALPLTTSSAAAPTATSPTAGGSPLPSITLTNVALGNGSITASWTPLPVYTSYVVAATPQATNRASPPAVAIASTPPPGAPGSITGSSGTVGGLVEDCHEVYSVSVTPYSGNFAGPTATWDSWERPSGIVQSSPASPPYVVILLDGIGESKQGFTFNPYIPNDLNNLGEQPSYCPETFHPAGGLTGVPSWPATDFLQPPNGPGQFFNKWNFYDPLDNAGGNDPATNSNSTPCALNSPGPCAPGYQGIPTNEFMLDAIAAQGAVILPYSYRGINMISRTKFTFLPYTRCNSTPGQGGPGCNDLNIGAAGNMNFDITQDAATLDAEVTGANKLWPQAKIVILAHSQGGLIAWEWWQNPQSHHAGVVNLFSMDSPINGAVGVVPGTTAQISGVPAGYPDYFKRFTTDSGAPVPNAKTKPTGYTSGWLALDNNQGDPFRFIGTWGDSPKVNVCIGVTLKSGACVGLLADSFYSYGDLGAPPCCPPAVGSPYSDETLQHQLLVTGSQCNNQGSITDCPATPAGPDYVSPCSVNNDSSKGAVSPDWVLKDPHFIVKFCPDNVKYFNQTLGLSY